ncbi:MAG TPA: acyclic terpene utilization AtuA family protein [Gemmatimonadales bacterium]|nr:acyclic terpene utilization AtuA family protein [Gemmatimonadales bacterium]
MTDRIVRVAAGQGFWGDWLEAPVRQVQGGPIDYLMMDYLAEVTMSIMQKQKSRDPRAGYARDFIPLMERILPDLVRKKIRVTSNAGGVNPRGCAEALLEVAERLGVSDKLSIGLVTGDDILGQLDELIARGHTLNNMETGQPVTDIRDRVQSANVYLGMGPIVEALHQGADVVVTGRVTDTGLTLGPLFYEFGWRPDDWDKVAAGTVAGHIIECGAQCSGGNLLKDWRSVKDLANPGFPIVEASADGSFVVTKHGGTGGVVSVASVTEQLVYEMGDPRSYITPDGIADFTSITLRQMGRDRVRVSGIRGGPRTPLLKVSIAYSYGYKAVGTLVYSWPEAYAKAQAADQILRQRLRDLGLQFEQILSEFVGVNATHGPLSGPPDPDAPEVQLRVGVRARERAPVERFTREIAPLVLTGPPSVTGFAGGRPAVEEVVAYWPALIDRNEIEPQVRVEILGAGKRESGEAKQEARLDSVRSVRAQQSNAN